MSKGCFPVIMKKNHPFEAKLYFPKREDKICKHSKRTRLRCLRKAFFVTSLILKTQSQKRNRVPLKYQSSYNPLFTMTTRWPRGRAEVVYTRDCSIFIPASTPVGVASIYCFDNIFILIFSIISIAFVTIEQFSFRVSCHDAWLSKLKWQTGYLQNNYWFDCSIKIKYLAKCLIQTKVALRWIKSKSYKFCVVSVKPKCLSHAFYC